MIKGGVPTPFFSRARGMNVQQSAYGSTIPLYYGLTQGRGLLVWYNDWKTHDNPTNQVLWEILGYGKNKKSKKSGTKYYSVALDLVVGHAPLRGIFAAWYNNLKLGVVKCSASGTISGGAFSFTPKITTSTVTFTGNVPASGPYVITVSNFISDLNAVNVNGTFLQPVSSSPGAGQYSVDTAGNYTFNVAQAGQPVSIKYRSSVGSSSVLFPTNLFDILGQIVLGIFTGGNAACTGVYACTIAEPFSTTFNDYGGNGSVTVSGTWDRPLWNSSFPIPGRVDAGAYTARDPYSWSWNGVSTIGSSITINFPVALNGFPVTVYFGVPVIYKSNGDYFTSSLTPLQILNMEWEQVFGSGSEYANHPDQQLIQSWCSGIGSPEFDLGVSNAMPNLSFEILGSFTQHPNGDCDVCDIATDILYSGPVLV